MTQTIEIPEGFELKKVSDTEYKIVKKEKCLPKTWEEFCELYPIKKDEYFITSGCRIEASDLGTRGSIIDKNLLSSKEKAEAILALCQLIQLRDCYNDGWKPDWNITSCKPIIYLCGGKFKTDLNTISERILVFKSEELRDEFFDNFRDLIEKLKPLYE